jgi:hypothetical protein
MHELFINLFFANTSVWLVAYEFIVANIFLWLAIWVVFASLTYELIHTIVYYSDWKRWLSLSLSASSVLAILSFAFFIIAGAARHG